MSHGVPQEAGAAGHMLIVVGGKPLVHHIEFRDPPVLGRVVPVPGDGEPPAVDQDYYCEIWIPVEKK